MFFRLLRAALTVALIFGAIWTAVILNWQATHRYPTTGDIMLRLVVLPTGVSAGYWIVRWLSGVVRAGWNKAATAQAAEAATPAAAEEAGAGEQAFRLHVLAGGVRLPPGNEADAVLAALEAGATPGLDDELRDIDGLPVFAARVPGLEIEALRRAAAAWAPPQGFSDEQLRALALADTLLEDLVGQAAMAVGPRPADAKVPPPPLRTLFMFPDHWPEETARSAGGWLRHRAAQNAWPQAQVLGEAVLVRDGAQALASLDSLLLMLNRNQAPDLCCVLACGSDVGEETLAGWARAGTLMSSTHKQGRIPGEGAAGVLLAVAAPAQGRGIAAPPPVLHRAALGRREQSADTQTRVSSDTIKQLCEQALQQASADVKAVDCLLSDADHRSSRAVEVGSLTVNLFTGLALERSYALELGCGHLGAAATIAGLALGASRVHAERKPAVVISVADSLERAALVLTAQPAPA